MEEQQRGRNELKEQTFDDFIRAVVDKSPPPAENNCMERYRVMPTKSFRTVGKIHETITYPHEVYCGSDKSGNQIWRRRVSFRIPAQHIGKMTAFRNPDTGATVMLYGFYHENVRLLTVCCIDDEPLFLLGCLHDLLGVSQPEKFARYHFRDVKCLSKYMCKVDLPWGCTWRTINDELEEKHRGILAVTKIGLRRLCHVDKRVKGIMSRTIPRKRLTGRDIWRWIEDEVLPTLKVLRQGDPQGLTDAGDWDDEVEEMSKWIEEKLKKQK